MLRACGERCEPSTATRKTVVGVGARAIHGWQLDDRLLDDAYLPLSRGRAPQGLAEQAPLAGPLLGLGPQQLSQQSQFVGTSRLASLAAIWSTNACDGWGTDSSAASST